MCYLTVELLWLVDECISLMGRIEGDELLEGKVAVLGYLTVELLELVDKCSSLEGSVEGDELLKVKVDVLPDC